MENSPITPGHDNLYAVEEIVVFRNVTLVRANSAVEAADRAQVECSGRYFQLHLGTNLSHAYPIKEDADIVQIMQSTEQPDMTLEKFTKGRDKWLDQMIVEK
jgi:hypothetical protein